MELKLSKRKFLLTAATVTAAAFAWEPLTTLAEAAAVPGRRKLSLNGNWLFAQAGKEDWAAATVPGGVYTDLLAHGRIPDPFFRDNEKAVQWVGDSDWIYRRSFEVPVEALQNDRVLLRGEGLDTLAAIILNGQPVGTTNNMFRTWEFDVKPLLQAGQNEIEVHFSSPAAYMKQRESNQAPDKWIKGRAWVRKEPCSYGWDWGPSLPTCGIWRDITLETFNQARVTDVLIQQNHSRKQVTLDIATEIERTKESTSPIPASLSVTQNGQVIAQREFVISNNRGAVQVEIPEPKLWWPRGLGDQPLYHVEVALLSPGGRVIDSASRRIGLRELQIMLPQADAPLQFKINGIPFFAKGANWIPADSFPTRISAADCRRYVADAAAVNMNMLRFWGGGYYEDDALYDACDELGICVWLDFKFACAAYPAFDPAFMDNVKLEAQDNLKRLRHHPSIAVWCGNNEISLSWWKGPTWGDNRMSDADYDKLFKDLLAEQVRALAPEANYVSGSPDCGDTHYWDVWHGPKSFEAYRTQGGFMSEFGYQSFPEPRTVNAFTDAADRASAVTPVMGWHQRSGGVQGNQKIVSMILDYFRPPKDFETTLWLSQILQGYGIKLGAEYWRQSMPKTMGCVFWQYNDCWPGISWSSVDYFGRWKALHYLARRFYAPFLISGLENPAAGTIDIHLSSDSLQDQAGILTVKTTDVLGNIVSADAGDLSIPARKSARVKTVDLKDAIAKHGQGNLLTWLELDINGQRVAENLVTLVRPKELELADPHLAFTVKQDKQEFLVAITAEKPALWTWLTLANHDARYSDNFFHLAPKETAVIRVQPAQSQSLDEFTANLKCRSLFDTFRHA